MDSKNIELGFREVRLLFTLEEQGKETFDTGTAKKILQVSDSNARKIIYNLIKKGRLLRIKKGVYLLVPAKAGVEGSWSEHEYVIASKLASPYYIGYWSALNFYGYTEQTPMTVMIATTQRVRKERNILGVTYAFVTVQKKSFFGVAKTNSINFSDREKTIVDCLNHPEYCGGSGEIAKALTNSAGEISITKVVDYGERMGKGVIFKRLGYLLEKLEIEIPEPMFKKIKSKITKGYSYLNPLGVRKGKHNSKWRLIINVSEKDLTKR